MELIFREGRAERHQRIYDRTVSDPGVKGVVHNADEANDIVHAERNRDDRGGLLLCAQETQDEKQRDLDRGRAAWKRTRR